MSVLFVIILTFGLSFFWQVLLSFLLCLIIDFSFIIQLEAIPIFSSVNIIIVLIRLNRYFILTLSQILKVFFCLQLETHPQFLTFQGTRNIFSDQICL